MRDRENLHRIVEKKAELAIRGEQRLRENYQKLKREWTLEKGCNEVQKLPVYEYHRELESLRVQYFPKTYGLTILTEKDSMCVENWK